jgi:protein-tyrosine phosphatase
MQKVDFLMNLVNPGANTPVPDPYYGGNEGFENVYRMIDQATDVLIEKIKNYQ